MRFSQVSGAVALALFGVTGAWAAEEPAAEKSAPLRAEAVIVLHGFATCIAGRRADEARALLDTDFGTDEYSEKIRALALTSGCLNDGRLKFAHVLLAGGIAERLYKMDYGSRDIASVIPSDWTTAPIAARSEVEEVALCVVQKDPRGVRAVLDNAQANHFLKSKTESKSKSPPAPPCFRRARSRARRFRASVIMSGCRSRAIAACAWSK
jgi:hypothetical protein